MRPTRSRGGFTLVEIIVAAGLTVMLASLMLVVTHGALELWRRAQDAFTTDTHAAVVLDWIERDLQAAVVKEDGAVWLAVDIVNQPAALTNHGWVVAGALKPAGGMSDRSVPAGLSPGTFGLREARFGFSGAWLRFLTVNVESAASSPVAVSYQIARRPVSGTIAPGNTAAVRYSLFRSCVSPEATFATGYDLLAGYHHSGVVPPVQRAPGTLTNPHQADVIATNVVDFGVWLHAQDNGRNETRVFPVSASDVSYRARGASVPAIADVMVRVLTEAGAERLHQMENGVLVRPEEHADDGAWWWSTVEAHSRVYVRRIQLTAAAR